MKIESSVFKHNDSIPSKYTCDGENINPPLTFVDVPKETKSLVLIMDDPDVPKTIRADGMWDHWLVWNIHPRQEGIKEGEMALKGVVGRNTGGTFGYDGPCPPDKEHRYFFKLYALNKKLELTPETSKQGLKEAMEGHVVAKAELMGRYERG